MNYRDAWMIKKSEVEIYEDLLLGKGAFSEVYVGVVSGSNNFHLSFCNEEMKINRSDSPI